MYIYIYYKINNDTTISFTSFSVIMKGGTI